MMKSIVEEKSVTFKELEKKIFAYVCDVAVEMTQIILEDYDRELHDSRDTKKYRDKGCRTTTIKTVYGNVTYDRHVYQTEDEEGHKAYVYLLDEAVKMDKIGLISTNLAEKIASCVTENPYRVTADIISSTSGQTISHGGAWKLVQKLGERVSEEEKLQVKKMNADEAEGTREIKVLFEEMDGVWLRLQGKDHKSIAKQEMKVATIYEGWEKEDKSGSRLCGKKVIAGMEKSNEFHEKREAQIRSIYRADEIEYRILNGDGGSWIKDPYEPETVFQLDRFHIRQEIKRKLNWDKEAAREVEKLFEEEKMDEMLEYIRIYADSVDTGDEKDSRAKKARELYQYLNNNKEGLIPYQKRNIKLPEPPEGMRYGNMGVQENQNCTVITIRMKGNRKRWSVNGANNMAKLLYRKENKELVETVNRYAETLIFNIRMSEIITTLSAAKAPKKDGKGNSYVDVINMHVPLRDTIQTASRRVFAKALL
ncbi:ISLre2 family transposase [Roseburia sp. 499]|uniref:ISLre2 family transposase n=1 Tax=Roseburia sp. 499 TaxID=1261634 RepID=UPI000951D6C9|nr:ISLre2 family transposase [Roseburia sp. 499]WVK70513.1 ISLre2 family transposase [Roseburia sp. 499]